MITPRPSEWDGFGAYDGGRVSRLSDVELVAAHERESIAERYGRSARRLLAEIDSYLEFFAIARTA